MPINSFLYPGAKVNKTYDVSNSLRFDDGSSDTLQKTFSAGNQKTWSFSTWVKRSVLGVNNAKILGTDYAGLAEAYLLFKDNNQLHYGQYASGGAAANYGFQTNQVFRDTNAWYNILFVWDSTQSTSSDRMKLYVNGSQVTSFASSTYPSENLDGVWNSGRDHFIGGGTYGAKFDGYLCESVFVDGTALSPTDVGEFDANSPNIWKPIDVSGLTFGTNGFYQEYKQSGTSANSSGLGADTSGNDNHFTVNNLTAVDQSTDTCTNNFATLNNLVPNAATYSEGNLKITTSSNWESSGQSIPVTQGKWYAEFIASSNSAIIGVEDFDLVNTWSVLYFGSSANGVGYWNAYSGQLYKNNSYSSYAGGAFDSDDIVGIYLDMDNKYVYFSINGAMQNSGDPSSGSSGTGGEALSGTSYVMGGGNYTGNIQANFGAPPFAISSGNQDANGYGNFEYSPTVSGVNYYSINSKNIAEFG